jgi:trimethylamine:corrinoid methyltransferase-like protein
LSVSNFKNELNGNSEDDMKKANIVQPRLNTLDQQQIKKVHEYSLQILSSIGVRVDSQQARKLFARAIGSKAVEGDRVRIPADLVEWAIRTAGSGAFRRGRNVALLSGTANRQGGSFRTQTHGRLCSPGQ